MKNGSHSSRDETMKLTLNMVHSSTYRSKLSKKSIINKALQVISDIKRKERLQEQKCVSCFYLHSGMIVGQAFTPWKCLACEEENMYPNTGVPKLCDKCGKRYSLCVRCCADIHLHTRRKLLHERK